MDKDTYLRPYEASNALRVGVSTLRRWEKEGKITAYRSAGGVRMYPVSEVERLRSLTGADFKKNNDRDAVAEGFGDNEEEVTLANLFQKQQERERQEKELFISSETLVISEKPCFEKIGFTQGGFPENKKESN